MKMLGAYPIGYNLARELKPGTSLDIPRNSATTRTLAGAQIGDVLWIKEPWVLVKSRRHGRQGIQEAITGPISTKPPEHLRGFYHELRHIPQSALTLARADCRITLEVMGILPDAVRCQIHFRQIDAFMKARAA